MIQPKLKVRFREPSNTRTGRFFRLFGIEISNNYQLGYFHQTGYSGKQKNNKHDIVIIEKEDGLIVTVPNKSNYYKFIKTDKTATKKDWSGYWLFG